MAQNMEESVAAFVNMDVRAVTPDALRVLGLSVKTLIGKVEARLCAVIKECETWPMSCGLWAPELVGPQVEAMPAIVSIRIPPSADVLGG